MLTPAGFVKGLSHVGQAVKLRPRFIVALPVLDGKLLIVNGGIVQLLLLVHTRDVVKCARMEGVLQVTKLAQGSFVKCQRCINPALRGICIATDNLQRSKQRAERIQRWPAEKVIV